MQLTYKEPNCGAKFLPVKIGSCSLQIREKRLNYPTEICLIAPWCLYVSCTLHSFVFAQVDSLLQKWLSFGSVALRQKQSNLREDEEEKNTGEKLGHSEATSQISDLTKRGQTLQQECCSEGNHSVVFISCTHSLTDALALTPASARHMDVHEKCPS